MKIGGIMPGYLESSFQNQIMQSDEDADKIIYAFERAIAAGYHPEEVEQKIYRDLDIDPSDLTEFDKNRIQRRVEAAWRMHNNV